MKYTFRIITAISAFVIGVVAFSAWLFFSYVPKQSLATQQKMEVLVPPPEGKVNFYFLECAGKRSVFILENQTDHSIYAKIHRHDFWKEFKDYNLEFGLHLIEYKAPGSSFEDVSARWDAVEPFREITPNTKVRYGIELRKAQGEYIVKVPYMEDAEVARRLNEDWVSIIKQDFERVKASWKEVRTNIITNQCY